MNKREATFFGMVFVFALVFVAMTLVSLPQSGKSGAALERAGAAGQARDVDMPKLERLMREQYLSNREAEFYHPVTPNEPLPTSPISEQSNETTGAKHHEPGEDKSGVSGELAE